MKLRQILWVFVLLLMTGGVKAQLGGKGNFGVLSTPQSALVTGIGGQNVSLVSDDPSLQLSNPALLNKNMHNRLGLTYTPWFAYNNFNTFYASHIQDKGLTWGGGLLYNNYGTFKGYDPGGNPDADFQASDFVATAGVAQMRGNFSLGANLKLIGSNIAAYSAYGAAIDLGAAFVHPKKELRIGLVVKNIGFGFKNYTDNSTRIQMPLDVQAGITYKLAHMPLRFSVTTHSLNVWDVTYQNPNPFASNDPATRSSTTEESKPLFDQLARRVVLGGEFLLGKGFNIRVGYNHLINRELKQELAGGASGLSLGAMARIKAFEISYTQAWYHAQGSTGVISIVMDMQRLAGTKKAEATAPAPITQ